MFKVFFNHGLGQDNLERSSQCFALITFQEMKGEHLKETMISKGKIFFIDHTVLVPDNPLFFDRNAGTLYLRKILLKHMTYSYACIVALIRLRTPVEAVFHDHPGDTIAVAFKVIIAQFMLNIKNNKEAGCEANGQANNINGKKSLALCQVPDGCLDIIPEHTRFIFRWPMTDYRIE